jgi:hypothetical protein
VKSFRSNKKQDLYHKKGTKVERRKEKSRGDEPIWVIIYMYSEISQCNSMYNSLKQTKMPFFLKNREQKVKTGPVWGQGRI